MTLSSDTRHTGTTLSGLKQCTEHLPKWISWGNSRPGAGGDKVPKNRILRQLGKSWAITMGSLDLLLSAGFLARAVTLEVDLRDSQHR